MMMTITMATMQSTTMQLVTTDKEDKIFEKSDNQPAVMEMAMATALATGTATTMAIPSNSRIKEM